MTTEQKLTYYFEQWCVLDPKLPIAKNGDGEYENQTTFDFYKCAEYIYKKGVWDGAAQLQKNMSQQSRDELIGKLCKDMEFLIYGCEELEKSNEVALPNNAIHIAKQALTEAKTKGYDHD